MLVELEVRGLALIAGLGFELSPGLTVISGETGGGKSLLVQALRLLRGERARPGLVREGAERACVDGRFALREGERSARVRELYAEVLGAEPDEDGLLLSRVVDSAGRSRARVDGRPITQRDLARFGELLVEIHGQGDNRLLMRPEVQTEICDALAGTSDERLVFARELREARALAAELADLRANAAERAERAAFLRFCLAEIAEVDPAPGEHASLSAESRVLANLDALRNGLGRALHALYDAEEGAIAERVATLAAELGALEQFDARLREGTRLLGEAGILLDESVRELRDALGRLDLDEGRLAEVEARLSLLEGVLHRFGPDEDALHAARERMTVELDELDGEARGPDALEAELGERIARLAKLGASLTRARKKAARRLEAEAARELADLGMPDVEVGLRVVESDGDDLLARASELGTSECEVWLAPNPGEPTRPLAQVASGGEVARVMLVLKKLLADADRVPVLVFDETDSEIGGRLGLAVGRKLREVSKSHQVLCVTHLPQIAAFADLHLAVGKRVVASGARGPRTLTELRALGAAERRRELASMSRGDAAVDRAALREAQRLLELAEQQGS